MISRGMEPQIFLLANLKGDLFILKIVFSNVDPCIPKMKLDDVQLDFFLTFRRMFLFEIALTNQFLADLNRTLTLANSICSLRLVK